MARIRAAAAVVWVALAAACDTGPPPAASTAFPGDAQIADGEAARPAAERLVILHNNDLHFSFHHFAAFRDLVESLRRTEPNLLVLSGGDIVVRHPHRWPAGQGLEFYRRRGREMIALMNEVGYDAAVLGNHELFVHGDATREVLEAAAFPWLAANIEIGDAALPRPAPYASLITRGGLRVFVLGLSLINFDAPDGLRERDLFDTVREHLPLARAHDVFVLLNHRGVSDDIELANQFSEVDVIVGGHSHSLLTDGLHVNGVVIAQTGSLGHAPTRHGPLHVGSIVLEREGGRSVRACAEVFTLSADGLRRAASAGQSEPRELPLACPR